MTFKLKRGLLTPSAEATPEDFIIVDHDHSAADDCDDFASATSSSAGPMEQLEDMERYAQLALQTVASTANDVLHPPKGAYVHYIPQFYLH